jgi:hypothetical protein
MNIFGPKDVTGIVIDSKTGNPMEGAFVLAVYNESGGTLFGHSSSWCVRTKGVWTGPDGRFTFPKGKPNNPHLYAIKEGYILNPHRDAPPSPKEAEIKLADFRYLYLDRQGESKFDRSRWIECERPTIRQDAEANATYLRLLSKEARHRPNHGDMETLIQSVLNRLDSLPNAANQ